VHKLFAEIDQRDTVFRRIKCTPATLVIECLKTKVEITCSFYVRGGVEMATCPSCGREISSEIYVPASEGRTKVVRCSCGYEVTYQAPAPVTNKDVSFAEVLAGILRVLYVITLVVVLVAGCFLIQHAWNAVENRFFAFLSAAGIVLLMLFLVLYGISSVFNSALEKWIYGKQLWSSKSKYVSLWLDIEGMKYGFVFNIIFIAISWFTAMRHFDWQNWWNVFLGG
jgi:hypothetical protein